MEKQKKLSSLIRNIYKVLLSRGRTYAAFVDRDKEIMKQEFNKEDLILDPMSGYGSTTKFCSQLGFDSYTLEYNLPQYYWQILNHPEYFEKYIKVINALKGSFSLFPKGEKRAVASDEWFPDESKRLILQLLKTIDRYTELEFGDNQPNNSYTLALIMPFIGRFSCSVAGDNVTHVKKGGICVYRNWETDFQYYLDLVSDFLYKKKPIDIKRNHVILQGDARSFNFPSKKFSGMYTSPPYPNHRDFNSMFKPEHAFLNFLEEEQNTDDDLHVIGSNFVRGKEIQVSRNKTVQNFLDKIHNLSSRKKFQISHDDVYYVPYLNNYFSDLENAYKNVEKSLSDNFKGFIVVVDNTHRGYVIPVAESIIEMWRNWGYSAEVYKSFSLSHVGAKNPRSKGVRAIHTESVIKIWK